MDIPQNVLDRINFFEYACKKAEAAYTLNPLDAENLTLWGSLLLELTQFQNGGDCIPIVQVAVSKLEEALSIEPKKHDTLWSLGNAHIAHGFYMADVDEAMVYFDRAMQCFQQALEEDPGNGLYAESLELCSRAPKMHPRLHRQMSSQQGAVGEPSTSNAKESEKNQCGGLTYDILGWVILAAGLIALVGMAKSRMPPSTF